MQKNTGIPKAFFRFPTQIVHFVGLPVYFLLFLLVYKPAGIIDFIDKGGVHSVAQGESRSFLSANAKKMAIGGVAGLVIACGLWFCSGIAPEFRLKKDENTGREEVVKG